MSDKFPITRVRRNTTAREIAQRVGVTERTIRNIVAEERAVYEARAQEIREQIIELRRQGMKQVPIAQKLGITQGLVSIRLKEARLAGVDLSPIAPSEKSPAA